ncbi:hypothetical protein DFH28DRAFT_1086991 [Melampsora americana]|nr:hypothetical protein DFH28DRAFT_1086991 [Melampsora americana]
MGYIGGSPVHPETAYSIRLLRLHHSLWKYCTVRTHGFTLALDEFLDPANPLILTKSNQATIDAYRHMLQKEKDLALCALSLTPLDQLAMNCPRCFVPLQPNEDPDECDYQFCADGNFQHRRHLAASPEFEEQEIETPPLFLGAGKLNEWKERVDKKGVDKGPVDPCTASHTAASDRRGVSTWKGCDETGLIGLVCRHDHVLKFVNVVQSGEK